MAEAEEAGITETDATEDEEETDEVMTEEGEIEDEGMTEEPTEDEMLPREADEDEDQEQFTSKENEKLLKELERVESRSGKPPESEVLKGKIDDKTMKELQQLEKEAKEIANRIHDMKTSIEELLTIQKMTKEQEKELEEKSLQLGELMETFDKTTKKIQEIIANTNILDSMPKRFPQEKHEEDVLPRVILCGLDDEYVPKLVVCHQKIKGTATTPQQCLPECPAKFPPPPAPPCAPPVSKTSCTKRYESTGEIDKIRMQLEKDITDKNRLLENLQIKLENLQNEIHRVARENAEMNEKIRKMQKNQTKKIQQSCQPQQICPSVVAARLKEYGNYTRKLEKTVAAMEADFDRVHKEICAAIKARDLMSKKPRCSKR